MRKVVIIASALLFSTASQGGYLEDLMSKNTSPSGITDDGNKSDIGEEYAIPDKNITNEKDLSLVLLSFEKEQEAKEARKRKAEAAKRKLAAAEAAKKAAEAKKKREAKKKNAFPTLEEQMQNFMGNKNGIPYTPVGSNGIPQAGHPLKVIPPKSTALIYGVFCKNGKCYALSDHLIYKEGDTVNGKKIMEITASFIRYKDGEKVWYTR